MELAGLKPVILQVNFHGILREHCQNEFCQWMISVPGCGWCYFILFGTSSEGI